MTTCLESIVQISTGRYEDVIEVKDDGIYPSQLLDHHEHQQDNGRLAVNGLGEHLFEAGGAGLFLLRQVIFYLKKNCLHIQRLAYNFRCVCI